ncbi:MAG: hypothetical protein JWL96_4266 [Sphingomonas bacterium]|uniref:methylamine utilization protein n=1 Tax=Sphingomonas bacterium TaxID=1895847 RepID=UPI0026060936|nr:methylamine utilization protein [Sphingomonas bacterium]MDB5712196.1 hypothetical protein [Sphingomonas bacterium]
MCKMRTASVLIAAMALGFAPLAAQAATVSVDVRGADGKPLAGAVVIVDTPHKPAGPLRISGPYVMAQEKISFQPHVLIVPVGASVSFPNHDAVRHHVYSFSTPKKFELKLYGRDESRSVVFDKPGLVALGCNIHDVMSGFIWVVDTPFAAQSDAGGHVAIANVPPGGATLRLWHPSIRAPGNVVSQAVTVAPAGYSGTLTARR